MANRTCGKKYQGKWNQSVGLVILVNGISNFVGYLCQSHPWRTVVVLFNIQLEGITGFIPFLSLKEKAIMQL